MVHAKLWKRILNEGIICDCGEGELCPINSGKVASLIIKAPIVYLGKVPSGVNSDNIFKACAVIPFPNMFVEFECEAGPGVLSSGRTLTNAHWCRGWFLESVKTDFGFSAFGTLLESSPHSGPCKVFQWGFDIDESGSLIRESDKEFKNVSWSEWLLKFPKKQREADMTHMIDVLLNALTLLNCKNVSLKPHEHDPQQALRASKRHGGSPENYRYHTLIVRSAGSKHGSSGISIDSMPFHKVRGHFAEYGPQFGNGLLFGKYAGRFFVPLFAKGDKKNGIVEKDYEIRPAPQPQENSHV